MIPVSVYTCTESLIFLTLSVKVISYYINVHEPTTANFLHYVKGSNDGVG